MTEFAADDFEVLHPGVYMGREKESIETFLTANAALTARGLVDGRALANGTVPPGTPGVGPIQGVTEAMVRYQNDKFDPDNRLLHDAEYARERGFENIPAMPCFATHDDTFLIPWPYDSRDTLLVSQLQYSVNSYAPVYPGDTLHYTNDRVLFDDRTATEGSTYRALAMRGEGSVYNQRGEKVNDFTGNALEMVRIFKPGRRPATMGFLDVWEAPDWTARPLHYYSDADWDFIRSVWAAERRRGAQPLYWEDVNVGDQPAWTADGPIEASVLPTPVFGMGTGGSRSMRREIMDPESFRTMIRGQKDGVYRLPNVDDYIPPVPDGVVALGGIDPQATESLKIRTTDIHKDGPARSVLINHFGRDIAIRHINNWMGEHGWLKNIRWGIMDVEAHAALGKVVTKNPHLEDFLAHVPHMAGRHVTVHGLTGDLALVKSYVYDKRVRDGEFVVDLAYWIENIEGDIWLSGAAVVRLPSRRA
jgi:hypothetical protein